ncbi:MAG: hypothetical protein MZW92_37565 [Comamonadaceae bacterium]|nr:hypothetical protein [Comamonadaceae bacterium]
MGGLFFDLTSTKRFRHAGPHRCRQYDRGQAVGLTEGDQVIEHLRQLLLVSKPDVATLGTFHAQTSLDIAPLILQNGGHGKGSGFGA